MRAHFGELSRALLAVVLVGGIFAWISPAFLTSANLTILVKHVAINAILGIGMTFVILSGGIDLSVGAIVGLAGMVAGGWWFTSTPGWWSRPRWPRVWRSGWSTACWFRAFP